MPAERDVRAFDTRASGYERGRLGKLHRDIVDRSIGVALQYANQPLRVLDVGCGTGYLLRRIEARTPPTSVLFGVEPAPAMAQLARINTATSRVQLVRAVAEHLPYHDGSFDLVVSTTSFDHWADQPRGLIECHRVMTPAGHLVLVDLFSPALLPTLLGARRTKARTKRRAQALLTTSGFRSIVWHDIYGRLIRAAVAVKAAAS